MEEGPEPMKDMKPVPKNPNSVDQFREAHEAEYEARSRPSTDRVKEVHQHNMAYPKLLDELNKRRSTVQIKTNENKTKNGNSKCGACIKLRQLAELQKLKIKPKCGKQMARRSKLRKTRNTRIRKNKRKKRVRIREPKCKCCCYNGNLAKRYRNQGLRHYGREEVGFTSKDSRSDSVVNSLGDPDTSVPSLSSYNSYPSLEHEPLVKMRY